MLDAVYDCMHMSKYEKMPIISLKENCIFTFGSDMVSLKIVEIKTLFFQQPNEIKYILFPIHWLILFLKHAPNIFKVQFNEN